MELDFMCHSKREAQSSSLLQHNTKIDLDP